MAQLTVSIISHDDEFKRQAAQLLRACGVPVGILEGRNGSEGTSPDVALVDIRADVSSGMAAIERLRAAHPAIALFAIASTPEPDLILQAMRAGATARSAAPRPGVMRPARARVLPASPMPSSARRAAPGRRRYP
jgi:DNA-binding NarL/FixJ family response regulator